MSHDHSHGPSVEDAANSPAASRRLAIAFALVFSIVIAQGIGAWVSGSLALVIDMIHSLVDSLGLLMALVAAHLMSRPPSKRYTWGFRRAESLAALGQGALLMGVSLYAVIDGIGRIANPPHVDARDMIGFAVVGLVLNLAAMLVLYADRDANLNMRGAFLEVAIDAMGTVAVIASGILMLTTGFAYADTIAAFIIAAMIVPRAIALLRSAIRMLMEFTPHGLDLDEVRACLMTVDHVVDVHDMHASQIATGLPVLTAHVIVTDECFETGHAVDILRDVRACVLEHFDVSIKHSTFQIEPISFASNEPREFLHR